MRPMYIFPRQDKWILRKGFLRGELGEHQEELEEFCPMGNPNKCTPVDYDKLPDMLHEHEEGRNMKGFTPKLIGYLKFMFGTKNITNVDVFQRESRILMGTDNAFSSTLYLMLLHNKNKHNFSSISDLLSNLPSEDYEIPTVYEYEVVYFGAESMFHEPEECDGDGYGEYSGEECDCNSAEKTVEDEEGYVETEVCDDVYEDDCECVEWKNKEYEMYTNDTCRKVIFSLKKLEGTDIDTNYTYGYDEIYELEGELGAEGLDWIMEMDRDWET